MNHCFKTVWSAVRKCLVTVHEHTASCVKGTAGSLLVGKHPLFCVLGVQTQNSVLQEDYGKNLKEIGFLEVAPAKGHLLCQMMRTNGLERAH